MRHRWMVLGIAGWVLVGGLQLTARMQAQEGPWDLGDVVGRAWESNPAYLAVQEQLVEVQAGIDQAWSSAYPQITLKSNWNQSRNPALLNSPDFENFVTQFPGAFTPRVQELFTIGFDIEQTVYSWGKVGAGIKAAEQALAATHSGVEVAKLDVARIAAHNYFEVLAASARRETVAQQQAVREEALAVVEARFEVEEATELERLRARASLAQVAPNVAAVDGQVRAARANLRAVLGWTSDLPELIQTESELPQIGSDGILIGRAITHRPEIRLIDADLEFVRLRSVISRAGRKPQIDLTGNIGRQVADPDNFSDDLYDDWRVGIGLDWSLFDGGMRESEAARFDSQRRRRRLDRLAAVLGIQAEVESSAAVYRASLAGLEAAQVAAQAAGEAARVGQEAYAEGVALQADLLDAQQVQAVADLVEVEARFTAWKAWADVCRAVGTDATDRDWVSDWVSE